MRGDRVTPASCPISSLGTNANVDNLPWPDVRLADPVEERQSPPWLFSFFLIGDLFLQDTIKSMTPLVSWSIVCSLTCQDGHNMNFKQLATDSYMWGHPPPQLNTS